MNRTQIYLPQKQANALKKEAAKRRVSMSFVIRDIIRERFEVPQQTVVSKQKRETLLEVAERIGRLGEPGPRDLASRVDHYLYGRK